MKIEQSVYNMCKDFIKYVERDRTWWGRIINHFGYSGFESCGLCAHYVGYYEGYRTPNVGSHLLPYFEHYTDSPNLSYPFGGFSIYSRERMQELMHKNPQRIAFAERIIKDYEEQ